MAKGNVEKFLEDINKFVNSEYKRGALDKFKTIVVITKESLAQAFLEGYQSLEEKKSDYIPLKIDDFYPIASKALDSARGWAENERTGGHIIESKKGEYLKYSAYRDIKRPYNLIKNKAVAELNLLLESKGSASLKNEKISKGEEASEEFIFKSGLHRGHQGITTVGSAQLSAAMKFLTQTRAMAGFAESFEATELSDIMKEIKSKMTTTGTKKSGGVLSLNENIFVEILLEPKSANAAGAQSFDYKNLRPKLENAVRDYVKNNNIEDLPGSKSIRENAIEGATFAVFNPLSKVKKSKSSKKVVYTGRKKQSVNKDQKYISKYHKGSNKKAKKSRRKPFKNTIPNLQMLIGILNEQLPRTVAKNMGDPRLNYRTGRFAASVQVTDIATTAKGFPSVGYTYMKYPYQTFEPGYRQGSIDRDPRKLIDSSIREIAAQFAIGRFYTRRV